MAVATRTCPRCGAPLSPNALFCSSCGMAIPAGASVACLRCGSPLVPGSGFCPRCGAPVVPPPPPGPAAGSPLPTTFAVPPAYAPVYPAPMWTPRIARPSDQKALSHVVNAALLGIVGFVLSIVLIAATPAFAYVGQAASESSGAANGASFAFLLILVVSSLILTLIEMWLYREAFGEISPYDAGFSTPRSLALVAMIGVGLLFFALVGLFTVLYQANSCAGGNAIPSNCINLGELLGFLGLVFVAAIATLVGFIGIVIGIWRLGTRYNEGLFKAGAILLIFINIVGAILILIAAHSARSRLSTMPTHPTFG